MHMNGRFFDDGFGFGASGDRVVSVPVVDPDLKTGQASEIPALALFTLRQRDVLDYTVDFSAWLAGNNAASLSAATFAVATGSPKTPTIAQQGFSPAGPCVVVLQPASNPSPGDAYWLDLTVTIAAVAATAQSPIALPARTLVRRIQFVVVAG